MYNESTGIREFNSSLLEVLNSDVHILYVNDGSTDNSLEEIKCIAEQCNNVSYISFSRNFGHQIALRAGLDSSKNFDAVLMMDSDFQHPIRLIPEMIRRWREGNKIVFTKRIYSNESLFKRMTSKAFYLPYEHIIRF